MKTADDISDELKGMGSALADMSRKMPYTVPGDYFSKLTGEICVAAANVQQTEGRQPEWSKEMPYEVPAAYFEALPGNLVSAGHEYDATAALPKANPYTAPGGYFDALPAHIMQAVKAEEKPERKTINITRIITWKRAMVAAAAAVVLGIGAGTFRYLQPTYPEKILASVPNSDIKEYLQHTYRVDVNRIVDNVGINELAIENKDIVQYLNETGWDVAE